jgi:hypothetical protein
VSEQNILNPTSTSLLSPDYSVKSSNPRTMARSQARSGRPYYKRVAAKGTVYQLVWNRRPFATYNSLLQWFAQYENDFFSFQDIERGRYFSGMFDDEPQFEVAGNEAVNITANFVSVPGLPLYQYPSNWARDAVFVEERDGLGNDAVKLTGTWDRRDQNYCLWSEAFDNAVWQKTTGVTVTPNLVAGPNDPPGVTSADAIAYNGSGASGDYRIFQTLLGSLILPSGVQTTASLWLRTASGSTTIRLVTNAGFTQVNCVLTTAWQRFPVSSVADGVSQSQVLLRSASGDNSAFTIYASAAQYEYGAAASTYAKTTAASALLPSPNADVSVHGGFGYWNSGAVTTDAAEWLYFGYGFRLWSYKAAYMGIANLYLDSVFQSAVDLYASAVTASAPVATVQSVPLGLHRVKLSPTNTMNGSATGKNIVADGIEVMR